VEAARHAAATARASAAAAQRNATTSH
jgi:hypothetical protein